MSDMGWPVFEKCTHPNLGSRDVCPDCCALVMRVCIRNGKFVHWLAAKMAEPTDLMCERGHESGGPNAVAHLCVTAGETAPSWDTLHRTQDGGYWIPPVYEQMTREVDEHLAGEEPRPLNPYGSISTEPERTYTHEQREQGRIIADAVTRR